MSTAEPVAKKRKVATRPTGLLHKFSPARGDPAALLHKVQQSKGSQDDHLTVGALRELEAKFARPSGQDNAAAKVTDKEVSIVQGMLDHYRTNRYAIWVLKHLTGSCRESAWVGKATAEMQLRDPEFVAALATAGFHVDRHENAAQALHDMLHRVFRSEKGIKTILRQPDMFLPQQTCLFAEAYAAMLERFIAGDSPSTELIRDVWMASFLNGWARRLENAALPAFIEAQTRDGPLTLEVRATSPMTQGLCTRTVTFRQGAGLKTIQHQLVQAWAECIDWNAHETVKQLRDAPLQAATSELLRQRNGVASYVPAVQKVLAGGDLVAHANILSVKMPGRDGAILPPSIVPLLRRGMHHGLWPSRSFSFTSSLSFLPPFFQLSLFLPSFFTLFVMLSPLLSGAVPDIGSGPTASVYHEEVQKLVHDNMANVARVQAGAKTEQATKRVVKAMGTRRMNDPDHAVWAAFEKLPLACQSRLRAAGHITNPVWMTAFNGLPTDQLRHDFATTGSAAARLTDHVWMTAFNDLPTDQLRHDFASTGSAAARLTDHVWMKAFKALPNDAVRHEFASTDWAVPKLMDPQWVQVFIQRVVTKEVSRVNWEAALAKRAADALSK